MQLPSGAKRTAKHKCVNVSPTARQDRFYERLSELGVMVYHDLMCVIAMGRCCRSAWSLAGAGCHFRRDPHSHLAVIGGVLCRNDSAALGLGTRAAATCRGWSTASLAVGGPVIKCPPPSERTQRYIRSQL
jgi:hypothetical protein